MVKMISLSVSEYAAITGLTHTEVREQIENKEVPCIIGIGGERRLVIDETHRYYAMSLEHCLPIKQNEIKMHGEIIHYTLTKISRKEFDERVSYILKSISSGGEDSHEYDDSMDGDVQLYRKLQLNTIYQSMLTTKIFVSILLSSDVGGIADVGQIKARSNLQLYSLAVGLAILELENIITLVQEDGMLKCIVNKFGQYQTNISRGVIRDRNNPDVVYTPTIEECDKNINKNDINNISEFTSEQEHEDKYSATNEIDVLEDDHTGEDINKINNMSGDLCDVLKNEDYNTYICYTPVGSVTKERDKETKKETNKERNKETCRKISESSTTEMIEPSTTEMIEPATTEMIEPATTEMIEPATIDRRKFGRKSRKDYENEALFARQDRIYVKDANDIYVYYTKALLRTGGRTKIVKTIVKILRDTPPEDLYAAIDNYKDEKSKNGRAEKRYNCTPETFFNGKYEGYLPGEYIADDGNAKESDKPAKQAFKMKNKVTI